MTGCVYVGFEYVSEKVIFLDRRGVMCRVFEVEGVGVFWALSLGFFFKVSDYFVRV